MLHAVGRRCLLDGFGFFKRRRPRGASPARRKAANSLPHSKTLCSRRFREGSFPAGGEGAEGGFFGGGSGRGKKDWAWRVSMSRARAGFWPPGRGEWSWRRRR